MGCSLTKYQKDKHDTFSALDIKTRGLPSSIVVTIGSPAQEVAKTNFFYDTSLPTANGMQLLETKRHDFYGPDASDYYETIIVNYDRGLEQAADWPYRERLYAVINPDQTQQSYSYQAGIYDDLNKVFSVEDGSFWQERIFNGTSDDLAGGTSLSSYDGVTIETIYMVANLSTMDVIIRDGRGNPVRVEKHVNTGTGSFDIATATDLTYDDEGNLTKREVVDTSNDPETVISTYDATWDMGKKTYEKDEDGTERNFFYDGLGRLKQVDVEEALNVVDGLDVDKVETRFNYDAANRIIKREVGATSPITSIWEYFTTGRLKSTTENSTAASDYQYLTSYSYADTPAEITTVTNPDAGVVVTELYRDGRLESVTDTAVVERYYDYGVKSTAGIEGYQWREVRIGSETSDRKSKTTRNWMGQTHTEEAPTWDGGTGYDFLRTFSYDGTTGLRDSISETGLADQIFEYNSHAQLTRSGLDVTGNGLDDDSEDRIREFVNVFWNDPSPDEWWVKSESYVRGIDPDGTPSGSLTLVEKSLNRLEGFASNTIRETKISDIHENETIVETVVDRTLKKRDEKTNYPDTDSDFAISTFANGRLLKRVTAEDVTSTFEYDSYGRTVGVNGTKGGSRYPIGH